jgi:transcriptional regulator with PAS, ATPase and Fis domain
MHVEPEAAPGPASPPAPDLQVVSGRGGDTESLSHGLRAVRDLLDSSDSVLFSLGSHGLAFLAAAGLGESARLAQSIERHRSQLEELVQGPCVVASPGCTRGDLDGPTLVESPLPGLLVLGERLHRRLAFGLAVSPRATVVAASQVRFAHSIFRDLTRELRDRDVVPAARQGLDARWESCRFAGLVGQSKSMRRLFRTIEKLAASDVNVLILGESGTGKELVARAIHETGLFAGRKFVAQNCAALPEALLESELFGHCKGAFTGANFEKRGLFEEANGGTFFLDEIADMPIPLQIKLLRVLQEGEIRRLGETRTRSVSVRIIAATNKILAEEVAHGRFREDLYYRLNVVKLDLAPLRRRREDVPLLARFFCDQICARLGRAPLRFDDGVVQRFLEYDWPGNVRELENEVERLVALHGDEADVKPYMLSERLRYGSHLDLSLDKLEEIRDLNRAVEYLERALIARGLERHGWNKSRAAVELGVSRQGLIKKIKRLDLVRPAPPRATAAVAETLDDEPPALQACLPFDADAD